MTAHDKEMLTEDYCEVLRWAVETRSRQRAARFKEPWRIGKTQTGIVLLRGWVKNGHMSIPFNT